MVFFVPITPIFFALLLLVCSATGSITFNTMAKFLQHSCTSLKASADAVLQAITTILHCCSIKNLVIFLL